MDEACKTLGWRGASVAVAGRPILGVGSGHARITQTLCWR